VNKVIDPGKSLYSHHTIADAMMCLRRYGITKELESMGVDTRESGIGLAAQQGRVVHVGLAHLYLKLGGPGVILNGQVMTADMIAEYANWQKAIAPSMPLERFDNILTALSAYEDTIIPIDRATFDIVSIETQYFYRVPGIDHPLAKRSQRADLVVREKQTGRVYMVDHKKVWRMSIDTEEQFIPHGQFIGYSIIGHREFGGDFGGVMLNRICLPYKNGRPKFDRTMLHHPMPVIRSFIESLRETIERITRYEGRPWQEWPGVYNELVCKGKYAECPYVKHCMHVR
jgi:hypothetical protein